MTVIGELQIEPKDVYGKTLYYPACSTSQAFCKLLKSKTLSKEQMRTIKDLGYTIQVKHTMLNL